MAVVLYDFIVMHREEIIERARQRVSERMPSAALEGRLDHGVSLFLTQLEASLEVVLGKTALHLVTTGSPADQSIFASAALHGQELLNNGFSVAQVVSGYGDVCQVVTELASETNAAISTRDFSAFNRCLDDAISGAMTAYVRQREREVADEGTERFGVLVHELRNLVHTATLAFDAIRTGTVGIAGSTGSMLARSLSGLGTLVERSLAEVRLEAGAVRPRRISVLEFIEETRVSAAMQALGLGVELRIGSVDRALMIDVDWYLLSSALSNLLQNAFKFTPTGGLVTLTTRATRERVSFDVADECGGLPAGKSEQLFRPFTQANADRSGLGLGLTVAMNAVRANQGELSVRNLPGVGCVFTIDLPRSGDEPEELTRTAVGAS